MVKTMQAPNNVFLTQWVLNYSVMILSLHTKNKSHKSCKQIQPCEFQVFSSKNMKNFKMFNVLYLYIFNLSAFLISLNTQRCTAITMNYFIVLKCIRDLCTKNI